MEGRLSAQPVPSCSPEAFIGAGLRWESDILSASMQVGETPTITAVLASHEPGGDPLVGVH